MRPRADHAEIHTIDPHGLRGSLGEVDVWRAPSPHRYGRRAEEELQAAACVPGCSWSPESPPRWCDTKKVLLEASTCAWKPSMLGNMLKFVSDTSVENPFYGSPRDPTFNEIVLSTDGWEAKMPHMIEAIFFVEGDGKKAMATRADALKVMARLQIEYPDAWVPLLSFDPERTEDPFHERFFEGNTVKNSRRSPILAMYTSSTSPHISPHRCSSTPGRPLRATRSIRRRSSSRR